LIVNFWFEVVILNKFA